MNLKEDYNKFSLLGTFSKSAFKRKDGTGGTISPEDYKKMELKVLKEDFKKVRRCLEWTMSFGKYKNKLRYIDVIHNDYDYFQWMIKKQILHPKIFEAFILYRDLLNKVEN